MASIIDFDKKLWFMHKGCDGKYYLLGNPHTFLGRIWAWCPLKERTFFLPITEIEEISEYSRCWIDGFLAGSEPPPPTNEDGDIDVDSDQYRKWQKKAKYIELQVNGTLNRTWPMRILSHAVFLHPTRKRLFESLLAIFNYVAIT